MSGSFDPLSGRPTGSAPTARVSRGESLPTGTQRQDRRGPGRGRGWWVAIVGLVVGLGLIAAGLLPRGADTSATAAPTTSPTTTTTTTTTTETTTTTTTTTETASVPDRQVITAPTSIDQTDGIEYEVPGRWQPSSVIPLADTDEYTLLSGAEDPEASCEYWPTGAGVHAEGSAVSLTERTQEYAVGLADAAFGSPAARPESTVVTAKAVQGVGWIGQEVVLHVRLPHALGCGPSEGTVAVVAMTTDEDPERTVLLAAFAGADTDEDTLREIVENARVQPTP